MKPKLSPAKDRHLSLIQIELSSIISMQHEIVQLANSIDWTSLEDYFGAFYSPNSGRTAISTRLMIALHYLKYMYDLSDEAVLEAWLENPYWQYFSGMKYFEHKFPFDSSSMTKWRKRIAKAGAEEMLKSTILSGLKLKVITTQEIQNVNIDTTVQEKNIRFPTDARLYQRGIVIIAKYAKAQGLTLRQTYTRKSKFILIAQQKYAHSRKLKLAQQCTKKLHTLLGRVLRDLDRKLPKETEKASFIEVIKKIHLQKKSDNNKIYSIHEPSVACIAKGKVHKKYEFGSKVSIASTNRSNFVLGALSFLGNPHDSKTLSSALGQLESFNLVTKNVFVDLGYRGHGIKNTTVHICDRRRKGRSLSLWKKIKRRAAIEPIIGHLKSEHRLNRNRLSSSTGDLLNALFSCIGYNLKKLLKSLKGSKSYILSFILDFISKMFKERAFV